MTNFELINSECTKHNAKLIVVTKLQDPENVLKLYSKGHRMFAENKVHHEPAVNLWSLGVHSSKHMPGVLGMIPENNLIINDFCSSFIFIDVIIQPKQYLANKKYACRDLNHDLFSLG